MAKKTLKIDNNELINNVSQLIKFAADNDLNELEFDTAEFGLKVKKRSQIAMMPVNMAASLDNQPSSAEVSKKTEVSKKPAYSKDKVISTPLAGVFYRAKSPTSPVLAKEGDYVSPGTVIGIVLACKNLNEIISDKSGKIAKFIKGNEANVSKGDDIVLLE